MGMRTRLAERTTAKVPADPVVLRTALSHASARTFANLPWQSDATAPKALILLQLPPPGATAEMAARLGPGWVTGTQLYSALAGAVGPRLILRENLAEDCNVAWVNALTTAPANALVLVDAGYSWLHWGRTPQALLYLALTEVARDQFAPARRHLLRAAQLSSEAIPFYYDPEQMLVTASRVASRKNAFIDYLAAGLAEGRSRHEVSALQEMFLELLSTITGRSVDDLRIADEELRGEEDPR
jgi:hypothetical protein